MTFTLMSLRHASMYFALALLGACSPNQSDQADESNGVTVDKKKHDMAEAIDLAKEEGDLATRGGEDLSKAPTRNPCTSNFGNQMSGTHGRLDGFLVSIVPPSNGSGCNRDNTHVHLQVEMNSEVYDVAVDIGTSTSDEIYFLEKSMSTPGGTWAQGWHPGENLAYPSLGVTSTQFNGATPSAAATNVENLLANVNEISVFGTGYSEKSGMHDIHYENGKSTDGAIVLNPTSSTSQLLLFRFDNDKF
jgi:hypothetical protein